MTPTWQSAALRLVSDLRNVFGDRLLSVVAYGPQLEGHAHEPLACLALVTELAVADLEACAGNVSHWHRSGVATPLILPQAEFARSLDAFPLEYGEIIRAHQRVYGDDPFDGLSIARDDLRRACETQIKSHVVHLREGFLESGGRPSAIGDLVASSAPAFTALLRHVAWLSGGPSQNRVQATRDGARAAGVPDPLVSEMLALEARTIVPTSDPARLFPEYLAACEQLARAIDTWRA